MSNPLESLSQESREIVLAAASLRKLAKKQGTPRANELVRAIDGLMAEVTGDSEFLRKASGYGTTRDIKTR